MDVSLNAVMYEKNVCANSLNDDLKRLYEWSVKWKMIFNHDHTKPAEEVIFTNRNLTLYNPVSYSGEDVMQVDYHKHLGFILGSKHIDGKIGKANQCIGIMKRLYNYLPRKALLQIYKSFIRPHLDYCGPYLQGTTPKRNTLALFLSHVGKSLYYQIGKYEHLILIGDFNSQMEEDAMKEFCETYNLKNLITEPTCFKNAQYPTLIDLFLTNKPTSFHSSMCIETGKSDFHKMTVCV